MKLLKAPGTKVVISTLLILTLFALSSYKPIENKDLTNTESITGIMNQETINEEIKLPAPRHDSKFSIEEVINKRRSHRSFVKSAISLEDLSQMLWAAYGITKIDESRDIFRGGYRTVPSAGATFPLEIYAVVGKVNDIETGVYRYISSGHKLVKIMDKDLRPLLAKAALNQEMIEDAPASLFFSAVFERTMQRYGDRARERYVCMEMGHVGQNVYLQAEALGLGTCAVGAFNDQQVSEIMQLAADEEALYIMPIGKYYRD